MPGGTACGVVMAPAGKTPKTKGKLSERVSTRIPCRSQNHGRESVTKGTVQTRTDFSEEPIFRINFGGSRECQFFQATIYCNFD